MALLLGAALLIVTGAPKPGAERLIVLPARVDPKIGAKAPGALDDMFAEALRATKKYKVITQKEIDAVLKAERQKDLLGCDDATCYAELFGALGARYVVSVELGSVDESNWLLSLRLIDSERMESASQASRYLPAYARAVSEAADGVTDALFASAALPADGIQLGRMCKWGDAADCQKQCDLDNHDSCLRLARMYLNGGGVATDRARYEAIARRTCDQGFAMACYDLGSFYMLGAQLAETDAAASALAKPIIPLLERACAGEIADGCAWLSSAVKNGWGVPRDLTRSLRFERRACELDRRSCSGLAIAFLEGVAVPKNVALAKAYGKIACDTGDADLVCQQLACMEGKQTVCDDMRKLNYRLWAEIK